MDSFSCCIPKKESVTVTEYAALLQRIQITELAAIDTYRAAIELGNYNGLDSSIIKELEEIRQDEIDHQMKLQYIAEKLDSSLASHKEDLPVL